MDERPGSEAAAALATVLEQGEGLDQAARDRLAAMAAELSTRDLPAEFVLAALRSTAEVLKELESATRTRAEAMNRAEVQQFIEANGAVQGDVPVVPARREWKQVERERLLGHTLALIRDARGARSRHEIKKTRRMLLKVDQRHLRRVLGTDGEDLCNQISLLLRSFASRM